MSFQEGLRRRQFSLLNLLLLGTTLASIAGLFGSWRTIRKLTESQRLVRAENEELRAETGMLTIGDATKVHAIQIIDPRDGVWKYRVYLPPGKKYYFAGQANKLPLNHEPPRYGPSAPPGPNSMKAGVSDRGGAIAARGCHPGEYLVSIALSRNDHGKKYFSAEMFPKTSGADHVTIGMTIAEQPGKWPAVELDPQDERGPIGTMEQGMGAGIQTVIAADSMAIVLLELRFMHSGVRRSDKSDEGLMIWIGVVDEEDS